MENPPQKVRLYLVEGYTLYRTDGQNKLLNSKFKEGYFLAQIKDIKKFGIITDRFYQPGDLVMPVPDPELSFCQPRGAIIPEKIERSVWVPKEEIRELHMAYSPVLKEQKSKIEEIRNRYTKQIEEQIRILEEKSATEIRALGVKSLNDILVEKFFR